jgi:tetratricopeptide (TPR) repeat protein
MSISPRTIRRDTRVFISAVTRELCSVRKLVKKGLEDNDYHAVEQDNFPPDYRDLIDKLRERIDSCDAVVHIAGHCYGAEPPERPADAPRRSYTQLEYEIAVELGKPVYVFLTGADFPADPHQPDAPELQELQAGHRLRLISTGQDFNPAASIQELDQKIRSLQLKVERLTDEIQQVDQKMDVHGGRLRRWFAAVAVLVVAGLGELGYVGWRQQGEQRAQQQEREKQERERIAAEAARQEAQNVIKVQQDFAERFLQQLLTNQEITAMDARQRALKELPGLVKLPLAEIESLINRKIAPAAAGEAPSPVDMARAALAKGDLDGVLKAADEEKQQGRELAMLEGTAALARFRQSPKPEWNARALAAFQRAMALADPNSATEWEAWTDAAVSAASLLCDLARYAEAEPLLRECQRLRESNSGRNSPGVTVVLNYLAGLLQATNRMAEAEPLFRQALAVDERSYGPDHPNVAADLSNLAELLRVTNRIGQAEPQYRRALAIDERSYGPDHPDVARVLNNLAGLLFATNRMAEAEPLYRRALAIDEQSYGPDHPNVGRALNNLADLLQATNRMAEAEPLFRRALAILERSYGPDNTRVATILNNLARLLQATNRMAEAEPLFRRALAIDERSHGSHYPELATALNNLALLLKAANRMAEAEALYRRALAIDERSHRPDHPNVARVLLNLAELLQTTNRMAEAEALYRRALAIDEPSHGAHHPEVAAALNNLALLLKGTNRMAEAEPLMRRALWIDEWSYGPDHPDVARDLNNLAALLLATNRVAEAEPVMRRALAIDERSYGVDHTQVAIHLNNLAGLLLATNRTAEAEPLMARAVRILSRFQRSTGHEHPQLRIVIINYREVLTLRKLAEPEIAARIKAANEQTDKLSPIVPEVERLLGPPKPVADVVSTLDRQHKEQGKPAVYFLGSDEPIAPHLDKLLRPTADGLTALGLAAFRAGAHAEAVVLFEAALELMAGQPAQVPAKLRTRMNRAVALRELGLLEQARDELSRLLPELEKTPAADPLMRGGARFHLALCQWRLGERAAAQRSAEQSLASYDGATKAKPVNPDFRRQSEELLGALKDGKVPPPPAAIDAPAALEAARDRYGARAELMKVGRRQPAAPLLDRILGPAKPMKEILDTLDRQYREQGKPAIWFLPLTEPMAPHLDQLLGPAKTVKEVLDGLDRQYHEQGKPAIWFLPLDEPISAHLDELLGKKSK